MKGITNIIIVLLVCCSLTGCKTKRVVTTEVSTMRTNSTAFHYQRHDSIRTFSELFEALQLEFAPRSGYIKIDSTGAVELHGVRHAVAERKQKAETSIIRNEQKDSTQEITAKEDRHEATPLKTGRCPVAACIIFSIALILIVYLIIRKVKNR